MKTEEIIVSDSEVLKQLIPDLKMWAWKTSEGDIYFAPSLTGAVTCYLSNEKGKYFLGAMYTDGSIYLDKEHIAKAGIDDGFKNFNTPQKKSLFRSCEVWPDNIMRIWDAIVDYLEKGPQIDAQS